MAKWFINNWPWLAGIGLLVLVLLKVLLFKILLSTKNTQAPQEQDPDQAPKEQP